MEGVTIRSAELNDREILSRLFHEFHEFHVMGVPDRLVSLDQQPEAYESPDLMGTLATIVNSEDAAILIAEIRQQIVGVVEVYIRQDEPSSVQHAYRHGFVQSLIVRKAWRGHGIGKQLMEESHRWARERGAQEIRLETWEFSAGPLQFYERLGYRTLRRILVRDL